MKIVLVLQWRVFFSFIFVLSFSDCICDPKVSYGISILCRSEINRLLNFQKACSSFCTNMHLFITRHSRHCFYISGEKCESFRPSIYNWILRTGVTELLFCDPRSVCGIKIIFEYCFVVISYYEIKFSLELITFDQLGSMKFILQAW